MSMSSSTRDWKTGQLQDLVFFQRGFDITQAQQNPGPYPVISSSGITSYHDEFKVNGPGVVIGRKGTLGSVHFSEDDYWPHDTTLWSKDFRGNNPRFVYYYLHTVNLRRFDVGNSNPTLNRNHIHSLPVLIPPLDIQSRIADILSAYDDLIENNRQRMELLEEAARQLYREWFVRLRFPGHEHTCITHDVPEGWERIAFENALVLQRGFDLPIQAREDGDVPIYGSTGINGFHSKSRAQGPGVVTGRSGTLGEVHYVTGDFWPLNTALWVKEFKRVTPLFSLFLLREIDLKQYNGGVSVPTLDRKTVHRVEVLVPPKNLLTAFDEFATPLFEQMENMKQQNQKLHAARDLLLPRLMSGEIVV
jgi:type I restriction enzyme S subunit